MNNQTQEVVRGSINTMSVELREFILGSGFERTTATILNDFDLDQHTSNEVSQNALLALMRLLSIHEFRTDIEEMLSTQNKQDVAEALFEAFNKQLFTTFPNDVIQDYLNDDGASLGTQSPLEQFLKKDADVQARFEKLPESVRTAMLSPEVAAQFSTIVREHAMEQEAFMTFGAHVVRVLAGLENVNELRTTLRDKKVVAHEEVEPVAQKVEVGMVKPVRDAIVKEVERRKAAK